MSDTLYLTNIGNVVAQAQDEGLDVWIWGFSPNGSHALIVDSDRNRVSVAPVGTVSGLGRWECTRSHLAANTSLYQERFPVR